MKIYDNFIDRIYVKDLYNESGIYKGGVNGLKKGYDRKYDYVYRLRRIYNHILELVESSDEKVCYMSFLGDDSSLNKRVVDELINSGYDCECSYVLGNVKGMVYTTFRISWEK